MASDFAQDASSPLERTQRQVEASQDAVWVEQVKGGDVRAFDKLVVKYRERIYGVIYNITSNREDAMDLAQETFIKAFRSMDRFRGKSSFFTWLYRIAVNLTLTHMRKNRMKRFFSFDTVDEELASSEILEALVDKIGTEKPALLKELQEKLNEALQSLSDKHRTVLVLFEIEGLSHQEIGAIVGCSEGTVRSRLHYSKQQLRHLLEPYLG